MTPTPPPPKPKSAGAPPTPSPTAVPNAGASLVAALFGNVDDLGFADGPVRRFELVGAAEILDQLSGRIRLAGVAVIGEPPAVGGREAPRIALVQVREDLAGAAVEPTVL